MKGTDAITEGESAEMDRPLSRSELEHLVRSGLVPQEHADRAFAAFRDAVDWVSWLRLWTGAIGATFLLAGVMFFFAHNWQELSPLVRFGVLEAGIVVTVIGAALARFRSAVGQWLLSAASVLTGVLIAVYGQVYQTGADAYEVFALWSVLMLAWVAMARFPPLWVFWLVIVETALMLYAGQVLMPDEMADWSLVMSGMGLVTFGFLALWEWLQGKDRFADFRQDWIRSVMLVAGLFWLSAVLWRWIFDFGYRSETLEASRWIGLALWLAAVGGGIFFYTRVRPSVLGMSLCVLDVAVIVACTFGRVLLEDTWDEPVGWLIAAILAIGIFGGATAVILRFAKGLPDDEESQPGEVV
ncbi:MAG: DUF2157 domain-containing protein [Verrucomicrobiales bacterium]|nr:DUF2157 domain-containing protein [Verrucomicrobiales bacterium]